MTDTADCVITADGARLEHFFNGVSCPACDYLKYRHGVLPDGRLTKDEYVLDVLSMTGPHDRRDYPWIRDDTDMPEPRME